MKFGVTYSSHWDGDFSQAEIYRRTIERMVLADKLGYYSAWMTEHHFANDPDYHPFDYKGQMRAYDLGCDPLTLMSNVAALTTNIRFGTGVLVLHYDHPLRVAERAAMLDVISGGRVELGIGRGSGFREPKAFGVPTDKEASRRKFFEEVEIMLLAWKGKPFKYEGEFFQFPELEVVPHPVQKGGIPLFVGAGDPASLTFAAKNDLSVCNVAGAWGWASIDRHMKAFEVFENVSAEIGRDISNLLYPDTLFCFCAETDAEAEEVAEEHLARFSFHVEAHYERQRHGQAALSAFANPSGMKTDGPPRVTEKDIRDLAKSQFETNLIGSPKTICEKIAAVKERMPTFNYALAIGDAGAPPDAFVKKSMTLFAQEVMPKFADKELEAAS